MSVDLLLAASPALDGRVATAFGRAPGCTVVRRCVDLADLLAVAASGVGAVAVVTGDLRGLDRTALGDLAAAGLGVIGVHASGDEEQERRLRQLGLVTVLPADAATDEVAEALERVERPAPAARQDQAGGGAEAGRSRFRPLADLDPGAGTPPAAAASAREPTGAEAVEALDPSNEPPADDEPPADEPGPRALIAVWGPAGAPGRTTVAVNLAVELARSTGSALLVDADTYGASVAQGLSLLDEAPGLAAAARASEQGTLDLPALARLAPEALPGLRVLTGLPKAERWPELRQRAVEHVLDLGRQLARFVVVDCGFSLEDDEELSYDTRAPRRNATTLVALEAADEVLAVGSADPVGLQRLVRGLQELTEVVAAEPTVVVTKIRAAAVGNRPEHQVREALGRFAGIPDPWLVPDDRAALDAAMLAGRSLAEHAPGSPAARAIADLAARLSGVEGGRRSRRARRGLTRWARA
ncbi:MAG TPA: hypothetical protein VFL99_11650 [Segeticoccus sp.]|uniref:AAA family ATPase n=1 Tax=Segeticoccus sp. TaxID=2706531 RepID=UPI002D80F89E|nr:hypothetical protein [Segeticoccus sp.]HET8600971.1 hypothetical protein [Segeticoccus sp.]